MTRVFATILLALAAPGIVGATMAAPATSTVDADFVRLAALVGEWRNAERPESPLRIRFALTAGATTLQESWLVGDRLHSLTTYHRDGDRLLLTHYCPQGNQPTLVQQDNPAILAFTFRSATDLDAAKESYLHDLSIDLSNPDRPVRREVYRSTQGDEPSVLVLERVVSGAAAPKR